MPPTYFVFRPIYFYYYLLIDNYDVLKIEDASLVDGSRHFGGTNRLRFQGIDFLP
jgi:hypothetical protein